MELSLLELASMDILLFFSSDLNSTGDFLYMENGNTSHFCESGGEKPPGGTTWRLTK
jgi:hypothetical protein